MKELLLHRQNDVCDGILRFGATTLRTLERPWIPTEPGGKPFQSCVPAGLYRLIPHTRAKGERVVALLNPGLGVYHSKYDRPNAIGRYDILIHAANWQHEIVGCIAPGMGRKDSEHGPMVTDSREAVGLIMDYIGDDEAELEIVGVNTYRGAA